MADTLRSAAQAVVDKAKLMAGRSANDPVWMVRDAEFSALRAALDAAPPAGLREALEALLGITYDGCTDRDTDDPCGSCRVIAQAMEAVKETHRG